MVVTDGSGSLTLVFFSKAAHAHAHRLIPGRRGMFSGKVSVFNRTRQLAHPDYQLLDAEDGEEAVDAFANRLIPLYPACKQITSWRIAQAVDTAIDSLAATGWAGVGEPLPAELRAGRDLVALPEALEKVHRPRNKQDIAVARHRLKWDEAFVLQVALARRRAAESALPAVPRVPGPDGLLTAFDAKLPFTLTEGQRTVSAEIFADLATDHPMHRLLQGEVGSGKTMVALRAMLGVVDTGGQAAMLAPTEVLAQQHHRSITEMMGELAESGMLGGSELGTKVVLLTGSMGTAARRQALLDLVSGDAGIVIGTHALIEDKVRFRDLGLVVVDEQHRFGVEQRDALRAKARAAAAPAGDDGDPDPAHGGDDGLRRPGDVGAGPVAGRALADRDPCRTGRGQAALPGAGLGAGAGGGRGGAPGVRGVPADRRRGGREGGRSRTTPSAGRRWPCWTSPSSSPPGRWRACGSRCCTAGWRRTRRTR